MDPTIDSELLCPLYIGSPKKRPLIVGFFLVILWFCLEEQATNSEDVELQSALQELSSETAGASVWKPLGCLWSLGFGV